MNGHGWEPSMRVLVACLGMAGGVLSASCPTPAMAGPDGVEELVGAICQSCHMIDGNSVVPLFPKLAGQQAHYLESQLEAWREGRRAIESMDPIRDQVRSRDVEALAEYFASKTASPGVVEDPALSAEGRRIYLDGNETAGVPALRSLATSGRARETSATHAWPGNTRPTRSRRCRTSGRACARVTGWGS